MFNDDVIIIWDSFIKLDLNKFIRKVFIGADVVFMKIQLLWGKNTFMCEPGLNSFKSYNCQELYQINVSMT